MNKTKQHYESAAVVKKYKREKFILPPERSLLNILHTRHRSSMLDLGVGTGRTTQYFAPHFEKYCGIDYSAGMITACKNRYPELNFLVADVTDMPEFNEGFDFIFFSSQGICNLEKMEDIENLIFRSIDLLNPGGIFAFSIQNANSIEKHYGFNFGINPLRWIPEILRRKQIHGNNASIEKYRGRVAYKISDDHSTSWQIRPDYILTLLGEKIAGFTEVQILNEKGIVCGSDLTDFFAHFICYK